MTTNSFYLHISQSGGHQISNKGRELVLAEHHDNTSTLPTTPSVAVAPRDRIADRDEIADHTAAVE